MDRDLLNQYDDDRLERLSKHGKPAGIPGWSGWRHPSDEDIIRLHVLHDIEREKGCVGHLHRAWRLVGQPITSKYLDQCRPPATDTNAAPEVHVDGQGDTIMVNAAANAAAVPVYTPPVPTDPSLLMLVGER